MTRAVMSAMAMALAAGSAFGQCEVTPMPAHTSTFSSSTRGYVFDAPVSFRITGVQVLVPPGGTQTFQNFSIVLLHEEPPFFSATTNNFTTLVTRLDQPANEFIAVDIQVNVGDKLGVYGNTMTASGATSGTNSYGNAPGGNFTTILGNQVDLRRSGMQFHLGSANPLNSNMHDIWREGTGNTSNITRIELCIDAGGCYADCDTSTGVGVLDIFDFLCFGNRFSAGDPYACDCDTSTGPLVCDIFDFLCFGNAFNAGCP